MKRQLPVAYRDLLRDAIRENEISSRSAGEGSLKRRKKHTKSESATDDHYEGDNSAPSFSNDESNSDVVETSPVLYIDDKKSLNVMFREIGREDPTVPSGPSVELVSGETSEPEDDFDDDDFEDIDLEGFGDSSRVEEKSKSHPYDFSEETDSNELTVKLNPRESEETVQKRKKSAKTTISTEERNIRIFIHTAYLVCMTVHGSIRNKWCNSPNIQRGLRKGLSLSIMQEIEDYRRPAPPNPNRPLEVQLKTRRFLDILRHLMEHWRRTFKIIQKSHLKKRLWSEISTPGKCDRVSFKKFNKQLLKTHRGSRDVSAQGFVALLRSLGFQARLVFSLQPPDFTITSAIETIESKRAKSESTSDVAASTAKPVKRKPLTSAERLLESLRTGKPITALSNHTSENRDLSDYPVFWSEVWNQHSKKWVSLDPVVLRTIEVISGPTKFEPPLSDSRNNAFYVVGYDGKGGVRDITRRYTVSFNAKTRKKRITRTPQGNSWWKKVLLSVCSSTRRFKDSLDNLEDEEFSKRSAHEGMPNNVQDFRNHPIYVLEEHLRANEVLQPKISCGTLRKKGTNKAVPVYRRSNLKIVRSAKAWYMRGRMLKTGQRPLVIREAPPKKKSNRNEDNFVLSEEDEEDTDLRLYSEDQTELYVPPPVVDCQVPKNAYGNIDLYTSSMLPEGGVYVGSKHAMKAAKIIGVDFAAAVIGFDFTGGKGGVAKTQGIVVAKEYAEAVNLTVEQLEYEEELAKRQRAEQLALRGWKVFLTRLRIMDRLNEEHGSLEDKEREEHKHDSESDNELGVFGGGFVPESRKRPAGYEDSVEEDEAPYRDDQGEDIYGDFAETNGGFFGGDDGDESGQEVGGFMENEELQEEKPDLSEFEVDDGKSPDRSDDIGGGFSVDEVAPAKEEPPASTKPCSFSYNRSLSSSSSDYDDVSESVSVNREVNIIDDPRNYTFISDGESDSRVPPKKHYLSHGRSKNSPIEISDSSGGPVSHDMISSGSENEHDVEEDAGHEEPFSDDGYEFEYSD
ncbi:unnamed protein product [Kuraishia capsulata CBS 1993]|uniref:Rad4 beta-hairpin domain-containing protein n=1 Tax=Kuraishia capsulata CBS 1993 TaxID=1382522 RepID=W6MF29_9ASCO|nr:uncharacterized protein KUCA_T00000129001 [Kuraishia capsulata CBS 1993]CDK24169.1 unnamed protein product [Kuraishia capsulata CBS 1993]